MSTSCNRTSGGFQRDQDSSEASPRVEKLHAKALSTPPNDYTKRLRPRPTKQTEHYESNSYFQTAFVNSPTSPCNTVSTKPKKRHLEGDNTNVNHKPLKKTPTKQSPGACAGTSWLNDNRASVKSSRKSSHKLQTIHQSIHGEFSSSNRVYTKNQTENPGIKSSADLISNSSFGHEGYQKLNSSGKHQTLQKTGKSSPDCIKRKPTTSCPCPKKRRSGEGNINSLNYKVTKFTIKTGSCASSRRSSEKSKQSSAPVSSSNLATPSDDGCSSTSNVAAMHSSRTRNSQESENNEQENPPETSESACSANTAAGSSNPSSVGVRSNNDTESEESDMTRLQALLEARGLPPHFFGNLGPRMQQILHRSVGSGSNSKAHQFLQGTQAIGDESRQLQAAIGMCQLLVMGNEDTLAGFPIKAAVPALINLLKMEHNFDLMNHACRALTYMMEALPRSSTFVVDAIPTFLEKLQVIQCMDVAEQSLTALEMLSRRHAQSILAAGGLASCLLYIDFFSLPAQRCALSVVANCCLAINTVSSTSNVEEDFVRLVKGSLPLLSTRLTHHDKKCVESACLCFVRLVDNYQSNPEILTEISKNNFFENLQQLFIVSPPLLNSSTFVMIVHTLTNMCLCVRFLANKLVKIGIAETLKYLLCGTTAEAESGQIELISRSPQELYEITLLINELLPKLPKSNPLFSINKKIWMDENMITSKKNNETDKAVWQWKDDAGEWRPYIRHDSRIIEYAHLIGEEEVNLTTMDRSYTIDFESMKQINNDTRTARNIQRIISKQSKDETIKSKKQQTSKDKSNAVLVDSEDICNFTMTLFTILYEVYNSSAGSPAIRYCCLRAIQRMVYYAKPQLLSSILQNLSVSSHISSMLSNPDIRVVVGALQLAEMLMQKLPDYFSELFYREGVLHHVKKLTDPTNPIVSCGKPIKLVPTKNLSKSGKKVQDREESAPQKCKVIPSSSVSLKSSSQQNTSRHSTKTRSFSLKDSDSSTGAKKKVSTRSTRSSTSSFLTSLNPTKWGRSSRNSDSSISSFTESSDKNIQVRVDGKNASGKIKRDSPRHSSISKFTTFDKEQTDLESVKKWVQDQAKQFLLDHTVKSTGDNSSTILEDLTNIAQSLYNSDASAMQESLKQLSKIINSVEVSSFEIQHSGIVSSLLHLLTYKSPPGQKKSTSEIDKASEVSVESAAEYKNDRNERIRFFLYAFAYLPITANVPSNKPIMHISADQLSAMLNLVRKLNECVSQLEQLPVKCHDMISGGSRILSVLSTHQLKCQLQRHPDCQNVKQWLGGPVKVDPLVQVQTIERYLLARGYGVGTSSMSASSSQLSHFSEDSDSEDEIQEVFEDDLSMDDAASDCVNNRHGNPVSEVDNASSTKSAAFDEQTDQRGRLASPDSSHKLDFYIENNKLPHHMTVYQAIQLYSPYCSQGNSESTFSVSENPLFWNKTHMIKYKFRAREEGKTQNKSASSKSKFMKRVKSEVNQNRATAKGNDAVWEYGNPPSPLSPLDHYLVSKLPPTFSIVDPCNEVLCLLRVIHAINNDWHFLYSLNAVCTNRLLVPASEFINQKINTKCSRQLQDPLIIITGQLPAWPRELAVTCPFILSFETRQLLFRITAFDRDRAMQHLLDIGAAQEFSTVMSNASNSGDSRNHSSQSRFLPRLEKKKCSVSRNNLLQQAEKIISEHGHMKTMIEIDYENEVGTGLGPTLEFFTLTSKELQKASLNLWKQELLPGQQIVNYEDEISHSDLDKDESKSECKVISFKPEDNLTLEDDITSSSINVTKSMDTDTSMGLGQYVSCSVGLFPQPVGRNAKSSTVNKIRNKFRFIGKFLAKALIDGRMVDLPLSIACYKWMLGRENSLSGLDIEYVDPGLASTFNKLKNVAHISEIITAENGNLDSVLMDGCPIEDLGLDMQLPGYPGIELMREGRNVPVTIRNLGKYLDLLSYWSLREGTRKQFEALRQGFNSILPLSSLEIFFPEELDQLFCGTRYQPWDVQELSEVCHPDHGYNQDSPTVKNFYGILSTYDQTQQRNFLQFVTGCPHLPVGGFRALNPRLTIVRKTCDDSENIDQYLPSVMTCLNYLKLPEYSSEQIMRQKLLLAADEGQRSFLLS